MQDLGAGELINIIYKNADVFSVSYECYEFGYNDTSVDLHRFPQDEKLRKKWICKCYHADKPVCIWWLIPPTCRWNFSHLFENIPAKSVEFQLFSALCYH